MKRTSWLGLLLAIAIAGGCTVTPHSPSSTSGSAHPATVATAPGSDVPPIPVGSATQTTVSGSVAAPISSETVRNELRGVHWVLASLQRGRTVTDVRAFTAVFLELTASHFTVDTGIRVFMFHYTGGQSSLLLGLPPPYEIGHGGYTRELGPAPQMLNEILQTTKSLGYLVSGNSLRLSADGLVLNFRADGPAIMHYWSEPDN